MTVRHRLSEVAWIVMVLVLVLALGEYQHRSAVLRLEGNHLYSADAVTAQMSPAAALGLVRRVGGEARAFVEAPDDPQIRVIAAADPEAVNLPVSRGRGFIRGERRAALAGTRFTQPPGTHEWVTIGTGGVPVVGTLGAAGDSLVGDDAIVLDDELFARAPVQAVTLDGPGVRAAAEEAVGVGKVRPARQGMAVRTDTDLLSPLIARLGWTVVALAVMVVGLTMGGARARIAAQLFLLGRTRPRLLAGALTSSVVPAFAAVGMAVPVTFAASASGWSAVVTPLAVAFLICVVSVAAVAWTRPWAVG